MLNRYRLFVSEVKKYGLKDARRYFFRWNRSLKKGASSVSDEQPWITFKAIDFLNKHCGASCRVFEYGGGGSTLFFVNRVAEVVTVEHNKEWFHILEQLIHKKATKLWKGQFILPENKELVAEPDPANPAHYSSDDVPSKGQNYRNYVRAIDPYPDDYFDCVVVDGRSRPACIQHAIPKIKAGGFLVLDNSDRSYYLTQTKTLIEKLFIEKVGGYGPSPYAQEFTHTTIWQKKEN